MDTYFHATPQYNQIHLLFSGYVDEMRNLLFSLSKTALKAVSKKYKSMVPEPLNRQFPERVDKATAVQRHLKRKNAETPLYPQGI